MNYIEQYWDEIKSGRVTVSKRIRKQYAKLIEAIHHPGKYYFDNDRATRPINFIEKFCRHSKGEWAGQRIELELFQKAFIAALFGFINTETGCRQYRETLFFVARKNGKSLLLSAIALYMMIADNEGGAEIFSVASKKDQARLTFDEAHNMVKQSPDLASHIKKRKTDLYFPATLSRFQPLGKNSDTLDGLNSHCVIIDELHCIKDRNLYEVMRQSMSARRQPLLVMITTAGTVRECIFDDMYEYACSVVDGIFEDETFLPIIYELDAKEEWQNQASWMKANPGLGIIKKLDDLQLKYERAKNNPKDLPGLLTKDFNIRDTVAAAWLPFDAINNTETFDIENFKGKFAIGGADLSVTRDLTCATLLFMDPHTEKLYVHQMYWLPEDSLQKHVELDKIPYDVWKERGLLRTCSGNTIDYRDVTTWFVEELQENEITPLWIYYDSYSARYWVEEMQQQGFEMVRCIQGSKTLSLPMQQLGADLVKHKVNYNNNPILKWCLTNTGIITDTNGNIKPLKNQQPRQRIDGTASLLDSYVGLYEHYEDFKRALE